MRSTHPAMPLKNVETIPTMSAATVTAKPRLSNPYLPLKNPRNKKLHPVLFMRKLEIPGAFAHFVERVCCLPAELFVCFCRIRIALCDIARAARSYDIRNADTGDTLERVHKLQHRIPLAGTEVINMHAAVMANTIAAAFLTLLMLLLLHLFT